MSFFDSHQDLRSSDEERVEFAEDYLEDRRFLYKDSEHEDNNVRNAESSRRTDNNVSLVSNGRGSFAASSSFGLLLLTSWLSKVQ